MSNRKTLTSKNGFSLVEVTLLDSNGHFVRTNYEVYGPDGDHLDSFGSLEEAQSYLKSVLPEPPKPPRGMGM